MDAEPGNNAFITETGSRVSFTDQGNLEIIAMLKRLKAEKRKREQLHAIRQKRYDELVKRETEIEKKNTQEIIESRIQKIKENSKKKHQEFKDQHEKELLSVNKHKSKFVPLKNYLYKRFEEKYKEDWLVAIHFNEQMLYTKGFLGYLSIKENSYRIKKIIENMEISKALQSMAKYLHLWKKMICNL